MKKATVRNLASVILLLTGALMLVFGAKVIFSIPKFSEAFRLATTKLPETFTELYFENHSNLPSTIERQKIYTFSFTVRNLENRDMTYPYEVYVLRGDTREVVDQGVLSVRNNENVTITESIGPLKKTRKKVVVELTQKKQIISFWMIE